MFVFRPILCTALLLCAACSKPEPPKKDQPPEPQASRAGESPAQRPARDGERHTELRDWMQAPINRAKAVEPKVLEAAKQQDQSIDAQVRGDDAPAPPN